MNFLEAYLTLNQLYSHSVQKNILTETKHINAESINLADCRMIISDVKDIRGEFEASACLEYNGELTRVQVRTVIIRETSEGREFLGRNFGRRFALPGGGYDIVKDNGDILNTAKREAYEEFNLNLTNLKDPGIHIWSHREDPWVIRHVANKEDRWTGYYSYYVVGTVAGFGNNDNPEEINQWKWYPIEQLKKINKDIYNYVTSLDEAWGDGSWGEQDYTETGKLSYCCESPVNLLKILESGLIKAASTPETHETDKLPRVPGSRGKAMPASYPYVSFSKQLYSHAYRRPNKWSFGLVLDEAALKANGYELVDRDHTYNSLCFEAVYTSESGKYMTKTSLYGYVEISKEIYDIIYEAMLYKSARMRSQANADNKFVAGSKNLTKKAAWEVVDSPVSVDKYKTANTYLKGLDFNNKKSFPGGQYHSMQYMVRLKELDKVKPGNSNIVLDYLLDNTYYNEGELRFWCKNNEPGVRFSPDDLHGVILPSIVTPEDYSEDLAEAALPVHHEMALTKILEYVNRHDLEVFSHNAMDAIHLKDLSVDRGIKTRGAR
jgi:8-oxo-dGTP pyrophosphatase MutT (NUDIX family)